MYDEKVMHCPGCEMDKLHGRDFDTWKCGTCKASNMVVRDLIISVVVKRAGVPRPKRPMWWAELGSLRVSGRTVAVAIQRLLEEVEAK